MMRFSKVALVAVWSVSFGCGQSPRSPFEKAEVFAENDENADVHDTRRPEKAQLNSQAENERDDHAKLVADAHSHLVRLAGELKIFPTSDFLFNRVAEDGGLSKDVPDYELLATELVQRTFDEPSLIELLKHDDAKVRTLAMAALFESGDPSVLPHIVTLADDVAATFPKAQSLSVRSPDGRRYSEEPQTVSEVCGAMADFYLKPAGYAYGIGGSRRNPGFEHYWDLRKERENCATWMLVRVLRAGGGISPPRQHRVAALHLVRQQIDALPEVDASLTLLWIAARRTEWDEQGGADATSGATRIATRADLIDACRRLGRERLMQILSRRPPTEDPDLQPRRRGNWLYFRMCLFILRNANELFDADDSATLLAIEAEEGKYLQNGISDPMLTPLWATAAATLQPANAHRILHDAYSRFDGKHDDDERADLAVALWKLCGSNETGFLKDWFYTERPQRGAFPHSRAYFLKQLSGTHDRSIYAALIEDDRFGQLDWQGVKAMAETVNQWADGHVVDPQELFETRHPFGEGQYNWQREEASKQYPEETAKLEATLSRWRSALSESIPRWNSPAVVPLRRR